MAKPNYAHEKKQREQAAKKKREEKQQRRQQKKDEPPSGPERSPVGMTTFGFAQPPSP